MEPMFRPLPPNPVREALTLFDRVALSIDKFADSSCGAEPDTIRQQVRRIMDSTFEATEVDRSQKKLVKQVKERYNEDLDDSVLHVPSDVKRLAKRWLRMGAVACGVTEQPDLELSERDWKILKTEPIVPYPMDCSRFAYYHFADPRLFRYLAQPETLYRGPTISDYYKQVDKPQLGALVRYMRLRDNSFKTCHFGIALDEKRVVSKWGNDFPIFTHSLSSVVAGYSSHVLFYIRPEKSDLTRVIRDEITRANKQGLRHFACRSPYSASYMQQLFREWIEKASAQHEETLFDSALFGKPFHRRYIKRLLNHFSPEVSWRTEVFPLLEAALEKGEATSLIWPVE